MIDRETKIPDGAHAAVVIAFTGPLVYRLRLCAGILLFLAGTLFPWRRGGKLVITTEAEGRIDA